MKIVLLLTIIFLLSACSTVSSDEQINFELDIETYSTEAANLRNDMLINQTEVAATISIASTQSSDFNRYNTMLRSTTVVIIPPTSNARIVANDVDGPLPPEVYDLSDGEMRFVQIGPAGQIDERNCFLAKQQFFPADANAVYMTAVALNLRAGTNVRADWQFGNELILSNSWVAPQTESYRCISIAMRPSDTEFFAGNWSVTLSVNGSPTEARPFTIFSR